MNVVRAYGGVFAALAVGLVLISLFPSEALIALSIAIPFSIIGAIFGTIYLAIIFRKQPEPRSRFFRMLVETFVSLMIIGVWVGYLSLARVLERAAAAGEDVITIPAPPPTISAPISALVVVVAFAAPIRFAVEVYLRRRRSARDSSDSSEADLDRTG